MRSSRYSSRIARALEAVGPDFVLTGNFLLVEKQPEEEVRTESGIITSVPVKNQVTSISANLPVFVTVLACGAGYYDPDTNDSKPLDTKAGDILLVGQNSVKWFGSLGWKGYEPFSIGITTEAETQLRFRGLEAYERFIKAVE